MPLFEIRLPGRRYPTSPLLHPTLKNGIKYVLVSHNTKMGAAKGTVLVAELLIRDGYIS
jgi:hypothetical protein